MPNKESFTFSDKLRKSKSVPLSKRLPSIVGGQNKQKRTLVQRAQRDLPFILVAALALLLLPFLSRTGSDDIASTGDLAWNTLTDAPSFAEGGGADIMPADSMQDPLDLILRPRSAVKTSGVTAGTDAKKSAYGSEDEDRYGSGYSSRSRSYSASGSSSDHPDYSTRKSYDESYTTKTTKTPATVRYGAKTRPSIRKSFERKGTEINRALRISQMNPNKGGTGVSHSLPIGKGPTRTPSNYNDPGVRPIALQPMESRGGVGRSMTGENLYAEARRSIGEMNRGGPAKANLLAAQMRDVDGKLSPQGPGFGGPGGGAAASKPGSGGGPTNKNGYSVAKPWWWDIMQSRNQKMWDLMYYKPREMFYTNLYKVGLGIFNCLLTGDKGGDVGSFLGKSAGDPKVVCEGNPNWTIELKKYLGQGKLTNKTADGKATEERSSVTEESWIKICEDGGGHVVSKDKSDKNLLQVRAECLGLDVLIDGIKNWNNKKYSAGCDGVTVDGISHYDANVTKKGLFSSEYKTNDRLNDRVIIALVAKHTGDKSGDYVDTGEGKYYDSHEYVVWAENSQSLSKEGKDFAKRFAKEAKTCELTKVISFVVGDIRSHAYINSFMKKSKDPDYKNSNKEIHPTLVDMPSRVVYAQEYCGGAF